MIKYRREGDIIRQKRIWYPGATYHAMARGIRRMVIFQDDTDYQGGCGRFLGPELSNSKTASILHRTQTP